ncbi:small subunit processome component 20 homolog isoform X2 [Periplaneta americana]|uniref:small subunit processome component 20 homolog isoform X2 n=1 Tax=Periplaneta americana TaxID=6978 RepID=UPI0037E98BAE
MKSKPKKHKEENTFQFQPFSERIANIDVDVFHRVGHKYEDNSEDSETYFHQALEKWGDLNLTESFESFRKEVPSVHTLPQLLQQKDDVVAALVKYMKLKNPLSLQPILELVVALARDLQQEFYPHYSEFVHNLIDLLNTKDSEQLEWTFTCLAYLFKFLWRYLVKDVRIVFNDLLPLLEESKPDYINNFAAESFAFVARKVKDKKAFLLLVLKTLKKHPEGIEGCGRLLFEVMHGVSGQFHSCANTMLPLAFELLENESVSNSLLFEVLTYVVTAIVKFIQPKESGLFWTSAFKTIGIFISTWEKDGICNHEPSYLVLKLILQAVNYKNAVFVSDPIMVVRQIMDLLKLQSVPEDILFISTEIGTALLMSSTVQLPQKYASRLILKSLAVPHTCVLLMFVKNVLNYPSFEALVLPQLLYHCQMLSLNNGTSITTGIGRNILNLFTQVVLHKAPLCETGMHLKKWQCYPLNFTKVALREDSKVTSFPNQFVDILSVSNTDEILRKVEDILCAVICIPHLKPLNQDNALEQLRNIIELLCSLLKQIPIYIENENNPFDRKIETEKEEKITNTLLVLATVLETVIHMTDRKSLKELCNAQFLLDSVLPYASVPKYLNALRALDLFFTAYVQEDDGSSDLLARLYAVLHDNLSSPYHKIRLLTVHLFSLFEHSLEPSSKLEGTMHWNVFSLCLSAESISPTIQEYRDKLQHLQSLEYTAIQNSLLQYPNYNLVPLYFLLGNLYINFQLLWESTSKLIASYARGMPVADFWNVFRKKLQASAQEIRYNNQDKMCSYSLRSGFLQDFFSFLNRLDDKPDYVNYRLLLWKTMLEFPEVCETKNRDISPLFLSFLEEEYFKTNAEMANSWNIRVRNKCAEEKNYDDSEPMDFEETNDDTGIIRDEFPKTQKSSQLSARTMIKTLLAHMNIFSKMKDPRSMYRESDLKRVYLDCLSHKNPEVQKMALDCLSAYKYKYLMPYREHLYGLIDDKTFKTELTVFRIDKESELIQKEDRHDLMPLIMRIVYSKMLIRTGMKSGGGSGQFRRSLVLRFLAGCHENEMITFAEMAFKIYAQMIQDNPVAMVDSILNELDLQHIIPPKRLQSSLNLLNVIMDKFGRLMGQKILPYLLRVLFCISAIIFGSLTQREIIHPGYLPILLRLRNSCQEISAKFFEHFDNYIWSNAEVDTVFRILVWPCLEKLPVEGIHSPTALLKLFLVWSRHPRYFVLLAKHAEGKKNIAPLPCIMDLLLRTQTHPSVTTAIMELVENLLTLQDYQEDWTESSEVTPKIPVSLLAGVDKESVRELSLCEDLNYGSCLLIPHIPAILERLERKIVSLKHRSLSQRDLVVLSRATELVWDAPTSDTLLRLLLPVLEKKAGSGEDIVSHIISTLNNLLKNIIHPEKHLRSMAPLFGVVGAPGPRKQLNELLITIANCSSEEKKADLIIGALLISKLNAFDAKWVEQPDFNQRLDGFKEVHEMLDKEQIDLEMGAIIIHNCFHCLRTEKDLSLKDSAGYCLRKVAPTLCLKYKEVPLDLEFLVNDTILQLIRTGIRDKNETVQHESIKLLGEMARECSDLHPVLQDLSKLTSKIDPEVDFFENILHLQSHRKSRALLKFCQVAKELTVAPSPRTLTCFILPLASMYLCSEKHGHKNNIVDAAIQTIGTICRLLPWHQYETILRFYLSKLRYQVDYQKQLVRIVVVILDAFHFNLSKAQLSKWITNVEVTNTLKAEGDIKSEEKSAGTFSMNEEGSIEDGAVTSSDKNKNKEDSGPDILVDQLESLLDLENDAFKVVEDEKESDTVYEDKEIPVLAIDKQAVLSKSVATHVIQTITTGLLPQIHRVMAQLTQSELSHKVNKKQTASEKEEEGILRVPIALAAVKLLQHLPSHMLNQNLPGILMKLCTFLKSRLESIRRVTRETLQKIMLTLGPKYLHILLQEMSAMLTRGYQVHVLIYTIHSLLVSLKELFRPGDIDSCLQMILELCKKDLFGAIAEEKEVNQITGKFHEARSTKSYDTLHILAQFVTEKCFVDLVLPIREILINSHSFKIINKCSECLRKLALGLADNTFVSVESLLIFMYGITSESIPELVSEMKKQEITPAQKEFLTRQRLDSFIVPPAPKICSSLNLSAKTSLKTNAHVLIEYGLRLFNIILKREKLRTIDYRPYLNPLIPIIRDCIMAQYVKLSTLALQCTSWVLKMDLPALKDNIKDIAASVFQLLHKYAAAGLSKGDNFDLVVSAFKVVAVLVRDVKYYTIDPEQMKALLLYAEQDMHDFNRQATAFALLKAILSRKLVAPEMHDVMDKVAKLSVTSEFAHIQLQARQVFHQFLMDYPLGKKLEHHLAFYISQLNYEVQSGRESVLEMMLSVITSFPINVLAKQSGLLFVSMGAQLVNDESPECRKMVAHCIKCMLERLDKSARDHLFDIATAWLKDKKVVHRQLAMQLCGIFVMIEKSAFQNRLPLLFTLSVQQFSSGSFDDNRPGRFVRVAQPCDNSNEAEKDQHLKDHHLFQVLQFLLKLCTYCPDILTAQKWQDEMETIAENAHNLLAHPHEWIRFAAAQLLGHIFSSLDARKVAEASSGRNTVSRNECGYFYNDTKQRLKSLILDFCAQLQPCEVGPELVEQVVKNLVFLGRVLMHITLEKQADKHEHEFEEDADDQMKLSLLWMIRRMKRIVNIEVTQAPKSIVMVYASCLERIPNLTGEQSDGITVF